MITLLSAVAVVCLGMVAGAQSGRRAGVEKWGVHDEARPMPPVVDPGPAGPPAPVPADAVVLFDGKDLSGWTTAKGTPATWTVRDGYMEVAKKAGSIRTKQGFGDCQLHVEWATPVARRSAQGQDRGNSGVFLMDLYEVQVLDSYQSKTYADGTGRGDLRPVPAAGQRQPQAGRVADLRHRLSRAPVRRNGGRVSPARLTVIHNGVLVQDDEELTGPTAHKARPPYKAHADKLPISLQDHAHPVRYRNIWIRELK